MTWRRRLLWISGVAVALSVAYCVVVVVHARSITPRIIAEASEPPWPHLSAADLDEHRRSILVAVEDPAFYEHQGVDVSTPGSGATTIPQSLVKRLYFDDFRPGFAKIRQTLIARFALVPAVGKDELLLLFANHVYMGEHEGAPLHGLEAAARAYFGVPFIELDDAQYLQLVATMLAPGRLDPRRHAEANLERVRRLERLVAGLCAPSGWMDVELDGCR